MTTQQRLINQTQASPVKDYPWLEAAQVTNPLETFYGSGFEGMLKAPPGYNKETSAYMTRRLLTAALAANRVPLAGLGFDPHHESFNDSLMAEGDAGKYYPKEDQIVTVGTPYINYPGSVDVHEALHRGNHILRHMDNMPYLAGADDENGVRVMMADLFGDPERFDRPDEFTQWVDQFNNPPDKSSQLLSQQFADQLGEVNRAAAQAIAMRRPMGPR